jgi:hypothetical protein
VEIGEFRFQANPGKNQEVSISKTRQAWWHMLVIPTIWEAEVRGSQSEQKCEILYENKLKAKGLGAWLKL